MNESEKSWEQIKSDYLDNVKRALSSVNHPKSNEVLEDVRAHLDRRFEELPPEKRDWENFQAIITDMGPPSDYAELLSEGQKPQSEKPSAGFLAAAVIIFIVVVAGLIILPLIHKPKAKTYKAAESREFTLSHPFTNDPQILGEWKTVDLVRNIGDFQEGKVFWKGRLTLRSATFLKNGKLIMDGTALKCGWSKGLIYEKNSGVEAEYVIKEMNHGIYLFLQMKHSKFYPIITKLLKNVSNSF